MANYVLTPSAVRKLRGVLAATPGNSGATGASSPVSIDDFPLPFTVRWSASAAEAGAWIIWLPDPARLVMFDGAYAALGGITAATALPAGWYTIDGVAASSDEIWLSITATKSDSGEIVSVAAALSAAEKQATTGETVYNIVVAEMTTATATGAKRVKQYVDSAVILGGESGDDFIPPFTVRWSESAWVIWLPDPAQLVMFDGSYTTIGGITAAPALPAGWYTIDGVAASSGKVWLVITITKSDSGEIVSVSAALSAAEKQAATGETVYNIVVADLSAETKSVKQFVDSAVILGGTSSGEGGDTPGEEPIVEIVGDIMYDISDHQLKKRIDTVNLKTGAVVEGNWVMIVGGQATPHTGEIS